MKRLQATERRLAKSPEIAKAYQQQFEEMNALKFARKLSDVKIRTIKAQFIMCLTMKSSDLRRRVHQFR